MTYLSITRMIFLLMAVSLIAFTASAQQPLLNLENALLVDIRTPQEYAEGTAEGAINIPLGELSTRLSEIPKDKKVVVFCRSGNRSTQAKTILDRNGYPTVINGGTWQQVNSEVANAKLAKK